MRLGGLHPEALRGFLGDESGFLAGRDGAEEEARREADRARRRRHEVRQIGERREVREPALGGQDRGERALAADKGPPVALEPGATSGAPAATGPPVGVPGQQHAGLLEDLAHARQPVGEGRHLVRRVADRPRGGLGREPAGPAESLVAPVGEVDLAAREGVVAAQEAHVARPADQEHLQSPSARPGRISRTEAAGRGSTGTTASVACAFRPLAAARGPHVPANERRGSQGLTPEAQPASDSQSPSEASSAIARLPLEPAKTGSSTTRTAPPP